VSFSEERPNCIRRNRASCIFKFSISSVEREDSAREAQLLVAFYDLRRAARSSDADLGILGSSSWVLTQDILLRCTRRRERFAAIL